MTSGFHIHSHPHSHIHEHEHTYIHYTYAHTQSGAGSKWSWEKVIRSSLCSCVQYVWWCHCGLKPAETKSGRKHSFSQFLEFVTSLHLRGQTTMAARACEGIGLFTLRSTGSQSRPQWRTSSNYTLLPTFTSYQYCHPTLNPSRDKLFIRFLLWSNCF